MKRKIEEMGDKGDQMHVRIKGVQLQTRMGPTKFYHFKTHHLDPSRSTHEIFFSY